MRNIGLVDYGTGNLRSVVKAFEHLGAQVTLIQESSALQDVDAVVFPGQGTFDQCMHCLVASGLDDLIRNWILAGKPYFGICLGLQVLFTSSEEGKEEGLGIFNGRVKRFALSSEYKIPHMGWNEVYWDNNDYLTEGLISGDQFYFVHSYHIGEIESDLLSFKTFYGYEFISGIRRENCVATQFHPEKSQDKGLQLYRNFLEKVV